MKVDFAFQVSQMFCSTMSSWGVRHLTIAVCVSMHVHACVWGNVCVELFTKNITKKDEKEKL